MKKIALCISGQPRYIDEGYKEICNFILSKYDVDCFVHTWWSDDLKNKQIILNDNRKCVYDEHTIEKIIKYYNPKLMLLEQQKIFKIFDDVDYETLNPQSVFSMFYSIKIANSLKQFYEKENDIEYDLVIRCRTDIKFNKFNLNLNILDKEFIYTDSVHPNIVNDQFAIGSSKKMDQYASLFDRMNEYKISGFKNFIGERLLTYHLNLNNLKLNFNKENLQNDILKLY